MVTYVILSIVVIIALMVLTACLFIAGSDEHAQRVAVTRMYKQLDTDYRHYQAATAEALGQAKREVARTQQFLLRQHQQGHDARLDIIRLAAEAERRQH